MTDREGWQKLKADPEKYRVHQERMAYYNRKYLQKLKTDPKKYKAYRERERAHFLRYIQKLKSDPEKFRDYRKRKNECLNRILAKRKAESLELNRRLDWEAYLEQGGDARNPSPRWREIGREFERLKNS